MILKITRIVFSNTGGDRPVYFAIGPCIQMALADIARIKISGKPMASVKPSPPWPKVPGTRGPLHKLKSRWLWTIHAHRYMIGKIFTSFDAFRRLFHFKIGGRSLR
jgi:hypothetical protein